MGMLYIVPTPVGNMEDMTLRAIRILKEVDLVLAEDTRTSGILLKHFDIKNQLMSHHKFNEHGTSAAVVNRLLAGENVALISDAGTPGISDPGFFLVREAVRAGVEVQTLPGATAFVPALVSSGLPCDRFAFEGFLPQKKGRKTKLESLREEQRTMIFYESPYRLVKTLQQFAEVLENLAGIGGHPFVPLQLGFVVGVEGDDDKIFAEPPEDLRVAPDACFHFAAVDAAVAGDVEENALTGSLGGLQPQAEHCNRT